MRRRNLGWGSMLGAFGFGAALSTAGLRAAPWPCPPPWPPRPLPPPHAPHARRRQNNIEKMTWHNLRQDCFPAICVAEKASDADRHAACAKIAAKGVCALLVREGRSRLLLGHYVPRRQHALRPAPATDRGTENRAQRRAARRVNEPASDYQAEVQVGEGALQGAVTRPGQVSSGGDGHRSLRHPVIEDGAAAQRRPAARPDAGRSFTRLAALTQCRARRRLCRRFRHAAGQRHHAAHLRAGGLPPARPRLLPRRRRDQAGALRRRAYDGARSLTPSGGR
eukprot:COSAG04_NODE_372_length_15668_cov_11.135975_3_plen_280_part_00